MLGAKKRAGLRLRLRALCLSCVHGGPESIAQHATHVSHTGPLPCACEFVAPVGLPACLLT